MKKTIPIICLLLLFIGTERTLMAQSKKNKTIDFSYVQLPLLKIDEQWKYQVEVIQLNKAEIQERKEEYREKVEKVNAENNKELESYNNIELAAYEKALNDYNNLSAVEQALKTKPTRPAKPYKKTVKPYFIGSLINEENLAKQFIDLKGFERATEDPDFIVKVKLEGFFYSSSRKSQDEKTNKYSHIISYFNMYKIEVIDKAQNVLWTGSFKHGEGLDEYVAVKDKSITEYYDMIVDENSLIAAAEIQSYNDVMEEANTAINDQIGYPIREKKIVMFKAKGKNYDYTEINDAFDQVAKGFVTLAEDYAETKKIWEEASTVWLKELENKDMKDKKSRINKIVAVALYMNLAYTSAILDDFERTSEYLQEIKTSNATRFSLSIEKLESFIKEFKARSAS